MYGLFIFLLRYSSESRYTVKEQSHSWEPDRSSIGSRNSPHFMEPEVSLLHFLSWARALPSLFSHPTSWRYILISSFYLSLGLPNGLFPSSIPTNAVCTSLVSHTCHMTRPSHSPVFYYLSNIWWTVQIINIQFRPEVTILHSTHI
jgi:hypothetical protein